MIFDDLKIGQKFRFLSDMELTTVCMKISNPYGGDANYVYLRPEKDMGKCGLGFLRDKVILIKRP